MFFQLLLFLYSLFYTPCSNPHIGYLSLYVNLTLSSRDWKLASENRMAVARCFRYYLQIVIDSETIILIILTLIRFPPRPRILSYQQISCYINILSFPMYLCYNRPF